LSLEADAQPTVDENTSCSSTTLEDVVIEMKKDIKDEIKGVKQLLETGNGETSGTKNETTLEEVAKDIKDHVDVVGYLLNDKIAHVAGCTDSNETRLEDVAKVMKELIKDEINEVKKMLALVSEEWKETKNETTLDDTVREIKNELAEVKKLLASHVCEYFVRLVLTRISN